MEIIKIICSVIQIISAISIIVLVLLQHGKGADAGATFGSGGGSGSLFGASGSANFLSKITAILATVFFVTTFSLGIILAGHSSGVGVMSSYLHHSATESNLSLPLNKQVTNGVNPSKTVNPKNQIPK